MGIVDPLLEEIRPAGWHRDPVFGAVDIRPVDDLHLDMDHRLAGMKIEKT